MSSHSHFIKLSVALLIITLVVLSSIGTNVLAGPSAQGTKAATKAAAAGAAVACPPGVTSTTVDLLPAAATKAATAAGTKAAAAATKAAAAATKAATAAGTKAAAAATKAAAMSPAEAALTSGQGCVLVASLTGAEESGGGDKNGKGSAAIVINAATNEVCYELMAEDLGPSKGAHIHKGAKGQDGDIVVPFTELNDKGVASGCVKDDKGVIADILKNPQGYYVNFHTSGYPKGAIRGQLYGAVVMTGKQEIPGPGAANGLGAAFAVINADKGQLCFGIGAEGITLPAAAAHIHKADAGKAGPVVIPLAAPDANGIASGCVAVDKTLASDVLKNPQGYYFNVHTSDFPNGALRGQIAVAKK